MSRLYETVLRYDQCIEQVAGYEAYVISQDSLLAVKQMLIRNLSGQVAVLTEMGVIKDSENRIIKRRADEYEKVYERQKRITRIFQGTTIISVLFIILI